jgi:hypothetical protein
MRVEIARSCKSLGRRVTLEGIKRDCIGTHSCPFPFPLVSDDIRPPVIVRFSEADQPGDVASEMDLWGSKLTIIGLAEGYLR